VNEVKNLPVKGVYDKKGFCALFGDEALRRKFSGRLIMSHFAFLSSHIHRAFADTETTQSLP